MIFTKTIQRNGTTVLRVNTNHDYYVMDGEDCFGLEVASNPRKDTTIRRGVTRLWSKIGLDEVQPRKIVLLFL